MTQCAEKPLVGVVMGSNSDWAVMQNAVSVLEEFGIAYEAKVVSAHRMPDEMFAYAESAKERGLACIIACTGIRVSTTITWNDWCLCFLLLLAGLLNRLRGRCFRCGRFLGRYFCWLRVGCCLRRLLRLLIVRLRWGCLLWLTGVRWLRDLRCAGFLRRVLLGGRTSGKRQRQCKGQCEN